LILTYLQELEHNDTTEEAERKLSAEEVQKRIEELRNRKQKYETYQKELEQTGKNEISTTDADARLMCNNNNNVDVSYNVQTTVDAKHKLIADFKITNKPNDLGELGLTSIDWTQKSGVRQHFLGSVQIV